MIKTLYSIFRITVHNDLWALCFRHGGTIYINLFYSDDLISPEVFKDVAHLLIPSY
jgi:hypothetical protein